MAPLAAALLLLAAAPAPSDIRQLVASDRWREAVAAARAGVAAAPGDADALTALGEALYRAGAIEESGETLAPLAAATSPPGRALAQLGLVRAAQGRDAEASALFDRALAASPQDRWVVYHAAGAAPTRARARELLSDYVARSEGDDADRIEGARSTLRLYAALGERKVWVPSARPERTTVPLKPLIGGGRDGFIVEAELENKKTIRLLLDTGSTGLFVVERAVKKGGYEPIGEETVFAGGGLGRTRSGRGLLHSIALGGLAFHDALVTTTKDEFDPQGRIHGVIGLSAFEGYLVRLDLQRGALVLEPPPATASGEPYWSVSGQLLVKAEAKGAPEPGLFLLDTGASRSMLGSAYAGTVSGAALAGSTVVKTYGGAVAGAAALRGVTLSFSGAVTRGDAVNRADLTQRSRLSEVEISGFLGLDLLSGTTVTIDTAHRRVAVAVAARGKD